MEKKHFHPLLFSVLLLLISSSGCERSTAILFDGLNYREVSPTQQEQYVFNVYFQVIRNTEGQQVFTNEAGLHLTPVTEEVIHLMRQLKYYRYLKN